MDKNFINNLEENLIILDFKKNTIQEEIGINLYFKQNGRDCIIVAPIINNIDYEEIFKQILFVADAIKAQLSADKIYILKLLIGENFDKEDNDFLDKYFELEDSLSVIYWGVDTKKNEFIIKKNQPTKLFKIEDCIKASFSDNLLEANKKVHIKKLSSNAYITYTIIYMLIAIHFLITNNKEIIFSAFAITPNLFENRELYRLITATVLHTDMMHLASNCITLYIFGTRAEEYLGKKFFILIYILGGITASISSVIFTQGFSVGASGAIFAIEGAILYFAIKTRGKLDGLEFSTIVVMSFISIIFGFSVDGIDNAGHIGGFISGVILCAISMKSITASYEEK